jgi:hypothetical protein
MRAAVDSQKLFKRTLNCTRLWMAWRVVLNAFFGGLVRCQYWLRGPDAFASLPSCCYTCGLMMKFTCFHMSPGQPWK